MKAVAALYRGPHLRALSEKNGLMSAKREIGKESVNERERKDVKVWEPWSSGYRRRLIICRSMSSNPGAGYWMDIFHNNFF